MNAAWVGIVGGLTGVLLGSGLSEILRRSSRIESYAARVFDKRMRVYEELFAKLVDAKAVAEEVMEQGKHSANERHAMVSSVVLDLAHFCDTHELYLNEELAIHCTASLMGAEDVADITSLEKQKEAAQRVRSGLQAARQMIRAESGIAKIDKFFGSLTRAKLSSPVIEYYRTISKQRNT